MIECNQLQTHLDDFDRFMRRYERTIEKYNQNERQAMWFNSLYKNYEQEIEIANQIIRIEQQTYLLSSKIQSANQTLHVQENISQILNEYTEIQNVVKFILESITKRFAEQKLLWQQLVQEKTLNKNLLTHQIKYLVRLGQDITTGSELIKLNIILEKLYAELRTALYDITINQVTIRRVVFLGIAVKQIVDSYHTIAYLYFTKAGHYSLHVSDYISDNGLEQCAMMTIDETKTFEKQMNEAVAILKNGLMNGTDWEITLTKLSTMLLNNHGRASEAHTIGTKLWNIYQGGFGSHDGQRQAIFIMNAFSSMLQMLCTYPIKNGEIEKRLFNSLNEFNQDMTPERINGVKKAVKWIYASENPHKRILNGLSRLFKKEEIEKISNAFNIAKTSNNLKPLDKLFFDKYDELLKLVKINIKFFNIQAMEIDNLNRKLHGPPATVTGAPSDLGNKRRFIDD